MLIGKRKRVSSDEKLALKVKRREQWRKRFVVFATTTDDEIVFFEVVERRVLRRWNGDGWWNAQYRRIEDRTELSRSERLQNRFDELWRKNSRPGVSHIEQRVLLEELQRVVVDSHKYGANFQRSVFDGFQWDMRD
jgi:4-hydroxyphenylpyruvate dioxygenase-like putative hemolysin